jgi:GNAT superfamily N-acetyltransferase
MPDSFLKYEFREAVMEDGQQIAALCFQLGYPNTGQAIVGRLTEIFLNPTQVVWIAHQLSGEIAGWVHALKVVYLESEPFVEIGGLVVDQALRGQGIGKKLMQLVERWTKLQGISVIRLRSNIIRSDAHAFYEKIGYQKVKTQYTFYKKLD